LIKKKLEFRKKKKEKKRKKRLKIFKKPTSFFLSEKGNFKTWREEKIEEEKKVWEEYQKAKESGDEKKIEKIEEKIKNGKNRL